MKLGQICDHCNLEAVDPSWTGTVVDPCLGVLPGVKLACCGHGERQGYVTFENGREIRFRLEEVWEIGPPPYSFERVPRRLIS